MVQASFFRKREENILECTLCPHHCRLKDGDRGLCLGRTNREGELIVENFGEVTSLAIDPVEKKPLFHFFPGSKILSLGTFGCNFRCSFCQNWQIAQRRANSQKLKPEDIVNLAKKHESIGIAYTYNEPLIWYEFVLETARLACKEGLKNVLVTNGYLEEEPLRKLIRYIHGVNLDLKAFKSDFYRSYCGGDIEIIKRNAVIIKEFCHLELTTLLITELNDDPGDIRALAGWIKKELGAETPLHLTRYHPAYKMEIPATPKEHLLRARKEADEELHYVYLGNIGVGMNTHCYRCNEVVIERNWFSVKVNLTENDLCPECGARIHLVW